MNLERNRNRMKLNRVIRKKKLATKARNILLEIHKAARRRNRYGKKDTIHTKIQKRLKKVKKEFNSGVHALMTWTEFMDEVCVPLGTKWSDYTEW